MEGNAVVGGAYVVVGILGPPAGGASVGIGGRTEPGLKLPMETSEQPRKVSWSPAPSAPVSLFTKFHRFPIKL